MTTQNESSDFAQQLSAQLLEQIFSETEQKFDLAGGKVKSNTDVRVIYLSTDIIHAIYDVLKYEAGDAWPLILKNCGVIWGKRVCASLEEELQFKIGKPLGSLTVESYIGVLEAYFARHGWGKMRFYLDDAEQNGIIRARLRNSIFATTLRFVSKPVDYMIAGMLQSIFSAISGHELGCVQVSFEHTGADSSEFLISSKARIEQLSELKKHEMTPNDILERLRAA
ncbi:hypothetical protein JCM14076_08020 [Methylosoma difficile]